ncbi:MAG: UPF0104 family protein [Chromatiaceae bacterium]|nr:MAG: UPF0104 family protein [Chromatiaceae bacterium]
MKQLVHLAVAGSVTALTLIYSLWGADLRSFGQTLIGGNLLVLPPYLMVLGVFFVSNAHRWGLVLRPFGRFTVQELLPSMMIGFAANNVLPLRLGELIRADLLARDAGLSRSGVMMSLALERLLDLIGILVVYAAALALVPTAPAGFRALAWFASIAIMGLGAVLAMFVLLPRRLDTPTRSLSSWVPSAIGRRCVIYLEQFRQGLCAVRNPATAALLILYSIGRWLLAVVLAWLAIYAYAGVVPVPIVMLTIGVTAFAVALPSAPGFVGPIQAAFVFALTPFGIDQEAALAASVLFLLGHWIPVTAFGAIFFVGRHLTFRKLAACAEAAADAPTAPPA